jgi:hypothetical protein
MENMTVWLRWWLFTMMVVAGTIVAMFAGVFELVWAADVTYLSFVIMTLAVGMTIRCGILTYNAAKAPDKITLENLSVLKESGELSASICARLGLVGTVIGFIIMLSSFATVDFTDVASTQTLIKSMSMGMGVALWTTLIGQICSIVVNIQYHNLTQFIERNLYGIPTLTFPTAQRKQRRKNEKKN